MGIAAKRILYLTSELPYPPEQGGSLRSYHLIRYAATHHAVSLLSFAERPRETDPLEKVCERVLTVPTPHRSTTDRLRTLLLSLRPDMAGRLASPTYAQALHHTVTTYPFDYVQAQSIEMAPYGLMVQDWLGDEGPKLIFDDFNAEYLLQRRALQADSRDPRRWPNALYSVLQWQRLRRFEREVCQRAHQVIAVSDADAAALRRLDPDLSPVVIPNGVETGQDGFSPERGRRTLVPPPGLAARPQSAPSNPFLRGRQASPSSPGATRPRSDGGRHGLCARRPPLHGRSDTLCGAHAHGRWNPAKAPGGDGSRIGYRLYLHGRGGSGRGAPGASVAGGHPPSVR